MPEDAVGAVAGAAESAVVEPICNESLGWLGAEVRGVPVFGGGANYWAGRNREEKRELSLLSQVALGSTRK